jgi:hypothetical protein
MQRRPLSGAPPHSSFLLFFFFSFLFFLLIFRFVWPLLPRMRLGDAASTECSAGEGRCQNHRSYGQGLHRLFLELEFPFGNLVASTMPFQWKQVLADDAPDIF